MISLNFILIIFLVLIAALFVYALFNLYHIFRYGHLDAASYFVTGLFVAGFIFILFVSYSHLSQIDFNDTFNIFGDISSFSNTQL